jgi:hypothetical protein
VRTKVVAARAITPKTLLACDYVFAPHVRAEGIMREHAKRTHMDTRSLAAKDLVLAIEKALFEALEEKK